MDPNTMEGALQSAMKIRQAQMDRDRAKFLTCTRPMQNSLFHGLYGGGGGGGEGGSPAKKNASLLGSDVNINDIDLLRRDLLEVQDLLRAELVRSGIILAATEQQQHQPPRLNNNNEDACQTAAPTTATTTTAIAATNVDTDNNDVAKDPSLSVSSVAEHRLKVLMCLHSVEKRLRLRSRRCQTADDDTDDDDDDDKITEGKDNSEVCIKSKEEEAGKVAPTEAEVECLRLLYLRTVLATASAFVNRRAPAARPAHRQADDRTATTTAGNNNNDSPTNDLSLAIDLLESGYALFGYLTPVNKDENNQSSSPLVPSKGSTLLGSEEEQILDNVSAPPIVGMETAMERLVSSSSSSSPKNVKAATTSATSGSSSNGGMDAIKDDAVSFHSLLDGVHALFDKKSGNKNNTVVVQSRKTRDNRHTNDNEEEEEAAAVASEPSDTTLVAARLVAHTILTSLAGSLSKEEITLLPTTTTSITTIPSTIPTALKSGSTTTTALSSLSLLLPQHKQQQQQLQQKEGHEDEDNTTFSPFSLASLRRYAQLGALADICCNLSVCYRREEEGGGGGAGGTTINRRDLEGEEVLEELLMSRRRRNGNGCVNHHEKGHATTRDVVDILDNEYIEEQQQHTQGQAEKTSFLYLVVHDVVDAILEKKSSSSPSFSTYPTAAIPHHRSSNTVINPLHLRSVYLLAKSMGCSISSTSDDARKAINILDARAIRPWGALFSSSPSSSSADNDDGVNGFAVSAAFSESFVKALSRAAAAPAAAAVVGNDATITDEGESSHYHHPQHDFSSSHAHHHLRTHSHFQHFDVIIHSFVPKLVSHLVKTIDILETQFKECVALRASLAAEVSKADALFLSRFQKSNKRAKEAEETEKNEVKEDMKKSEDKIEDGKKDERKGGEKQEHGEELEGRVKTGDNGSSVSAAIATASTVAAEGDVEGGADNVQTRKEPVSASADDTSLAGAEAPTATAARRRREEMEFRLRQEVERARKDLVVAVYGNLFTTSTRLPSVVTAAGGKETENKNDQKGSGINKKDGDFDEDAKEEARRRVLRYQPFASQPADHQKTYRTIVGRYTRARSALLDFLARRLFTSVMLPLRCFRVSPFAIAQKGRRGEEKGEEVEKEGKLPSFSSSSYFPFASSLSSTALSLPPPPTTIEEYFSWVGLFLDDTLSSSSRQTSTPTSTATIAQSSSSSPTALSSSPTVGLRKVLQTATLLGLNIVGEYNPKEDDFHHPVGIPPAGGGAGQEGATEGQREEDQEEKLLLEERLFSDAVASISNPSLFTLRQKEFLWESWEVRRRLRTIVFNFQFPTPTENNDERESKNLSSSSSRAAAPSSSDVSEAVPHRFSLMASGHMHTPEEMAIAQHFFTLTFAEGNSTTATATAANSPNAANERNYFISTFSDNNTGSSCSSLSPFFASARVASLSKISFNSLCEKSHNYLRRFLGSEAHDVRVSAALEDAQQRRRDIVRK